MRSTVFFLVLSTLALVASPPDAGAQVIYVALKNEQAEKQYDDYLVSFKGRKVLLGEPKQGFKITDAGISYDTVADKANNVLFVADPAHPDALPYDRSDGSKGPKGGKKVSFSGSVVERCGFVDRYLTLEGVAIEYERRANEVKSLRAERDASAKGSRDWFAAHGTMLAALDALHSWLLQFGYAPCAKKCRAEADREKKVVTKEATATREKAALASVKAAPVPEKLQEVAGKLLGGKVEYGARESMHVRFYYPTEVGDPVAEAALELAERLIDVWRKRFVDPYVDDDYVDYIPDQVLAEFCFVADDADVYEGFYNQLYARQWPPTDRERYRSGGGTSFGRGRKYYVSLHKLPPNVDIEGVVAHYMGHFLMDLHFNGGRQNDAQDWLEEGCGYYLSLDFLGRNSVTCFAWGKPTYDKPTVKDGEKTVQLGEKGNFNQLALSMGPLIDQLCIKKLHEFTDLELAKSWSFFDWVAKTQKRNGQVWLRRLCAASSRPGKSFLEAARPDAEKLFGVEAGTDVYRFLDDAWRTWAETEQLK